MTSYGSHPRFSPTQKRSSGVSAELSPGKRSKAEFRTPLAPKQGVVSSKVTGAMLEALSIMKGAEFTFFASEFNLSESKQSKGKPLPMQTQETRAQFLQHCQHLKASTFGPILDKLLTTLAQLCVRHPINAPYFRADQLWGLDNFIVQKLKRPGLSSQFSREVQTISNGDASAALVAQRFTQLTTFLTEPEQLDACLKMDEKAWVSYVAERTGLPPNWDERLQYQQFYPMIGASEALCNRLVATEPGQSEPSLAHKYRWLIKGLFPVKLRCCTFDICMWALWVTGRADQAAKDESKGPQLIEAALNEVISYATQYIQQASDLEFPAHWKLPDVLYMDGEGDDVLMEMAQRMCFAWYAERFSHGPIPAQKAHASRPFYWCSLPVGPSFDSVALWYIARGVQVVRDPESCNQDKVLTAFQCLATPEWHA